MRDYKYVWLLFPAIIFSSIALITNEYAFGLWSIISIYGILYVVSIFKDAIVLLGESEDKDGS